MTNDQGAHRRPPPFPLSIFFFLPSIASEPSSPPPPLRLPSLFFFTNNAAMALSAFPITANHSTTLSLRTTAMASHLLCPRLLFLLDPPSASLLSLSSTSDLPCSLFFLCCRSLLTDAVVAGSMVLSAESLKSPSPPYFPPMPPVTAHFFCLRTLHLRKHSHGNEHDHDNDRDTSEEGGDEEDDKENTSDPKVHGAPMIAVYQECIAGEERKEPPGEATLGNINAGLQKDPTAPNCDAVAVIFIVVTLLCCGDAFPPPSSSYPSPSALAP